MAADALDSQRRASQQDGRTLVVQSSFRRVPAWIERCMASVRSWAGHYEHVGDELLDLAPGWVHDAAGDSLLPVTDVARLLLLRDRLHDGWDRVVWLDADVCVFDPATVDVEIDADVAVCVERWVTGAPGGGLQAVPWVNNAALSARSVEDLLELTLDRVRAGDVQPRSLGPDLLTAVHRREPFGEIAGVSVASPHVVRGVPGAWDLLLASLPWPVGALNLCWSMAHHHHVLDRFVAWLLDGPPGHADGELADRDRPGHAGGELADRDRPGATEPASPTRPTPAGDVIGVPRDGRPAST